MANHTTRLFYRIQRRREKNIWDSFSQRFAQKTIHIRFRVFFLPSFAPQVPKRGQANVSSPPTERRLG